MGEADAALARECRERQADEAEALAAAQALPGVAKHVEGKVLRKVIYKPGRILNLVVPNK